MTPTPPKWIDYLLEKLCHRELWEGIRGDLQEIYERQLSVVGKRKATINYVLNALDFMRYHRLRNKGQQTQNTMGLINNYSKIAFRDIRKHKVFATLNITGLVLGIFACLMILQYVSFEFSFDRFHKDFDHVYRIVNDRYQGEKLIQHGTITYPTIGPTMHADYPEVADYTRVMPWGRVYLKRDDELFMEDTWLWADKRFLNFFSFAVIAGNPTTALEEVNSLVLTKSLADKLFDDHSGDYQQLLGHLIKLNNDDTPLKVTGVVEDTPANSHLNFNMLISYQTLISQQGPDADNSWTWSDFYHYIKLGPDVNVGALERKLVDFSDRHFQGEKVSGNGERFYLQPLGEAHLYSDFEYDFTRTSSGEIVWIMLVTALFILAVAWINYINLSTSRAIERAKEVGVRKVLGARREQLIFQFLLEALIINGISLLLALVLTSLSQPVFNQIISQELTLGIYLEPFLGAWPLWLYCSIAFISGVVISGVYPALLLSGYLPLTVLSNKMNQAGGHGLFRKSLVVFQFTIAVILIIGSMAIHQQIRFLQNRDLGFDAKNTAVFYGPQLTSFDSAYIPKFSSFKQALINQAGVKNVTSSNRMFGDRLGRVFRMTSDYDSLGAEYSSSFIQIDHDFVNNYDLKLLAGRDFGRGDHHLQWDKVVTLLLTRSAIDLLGFPTPEAAIDRKLQFWGKTWTIVGVVEDFHQRSPKQKIEPLLMMPALGTFHFYSVKLSNQDSPAILARIEELFNQFFPGNHFEHFYLEDYFNTQYVEDRQTAQVVSIFTVIAMVVAILGLYGLALFTSLKRTKEIGIRKVLGGSLRSILFLLSKDFLKLIVLSLLIGMPISYMLVEEWHTNFAQSYGLDWGIFTIAGTTLLVIAMITIGFRTFRVCTLNPIESLRDE